MKKTYTDYLIEDSVPDLQKMIPKRRGFREVAIMAMIPPAIVGIGMISMILPAAMAVDKYNELKERNLKDRRKINIKSPNE